MKSLFKNGVGDKTVKIDSQRFFIYEPLIQILAK